MTVLDLFAGLGGWELAARELGIDPIGVELMAEACATRAAAGLRTIRADLERFRIPDRLDGVIASPPCQDFSTAGKGAGRTGDRGRLIDLVPLWVEHARPRWVACEQVPPCEAIWREHAQRYERLGYSTFVGILNAADYGVPQTRRRAILLASLDRQPTRPDPTHSRDGGGLFPLAPWVSMSAALGWVPPTGTVRTGANSMKHSRDPGAVEPYERRADEPAPTVDRKSGSAWRVTSGQTVAGGPLATRDGDDPAFTVGARVDQWTVELHTNRDQRADGSRQVIPASEPAPTLTSKSGPQWEACAAGTPSGAMGVGAKLTVADALALQSFPESYPVQGTKAARFLQVGNAVPPLLARHVLAEVIA